MSNKNYESHRKAIVSKGIPPALLNRLTNSDVQVINTFLTRVSKLELTSFTIRSDPFRIQPAIIPLQSM
ncbi:hypothetical protein CPH39_21375 [Escherichia coli]|nr:hypothetical protein [Escherichia coli]QHD14052.1 hypothetical protein CPH39_21375 [Escherichia coli]HAG9239506.1 hypothetical protein [Escherichia coli]